MYVVRAKLLDAVGCFVGDLLLENLFREVFSEEFLKFPVDTVC